MVTAANSEMRKELTHVFDGQVVDFPPFGHSGPRHEPPERYQHRAQKKRRVASCAFPYFPEQEHTPKRIWCTVELI